jgi:hypothetical protein
MTWQSLLQRLSGLMQQQKRLVMVRTGVMDKLSRLGGLFKQMLAIRSGLDDRYMAELVTQEMFFDVAETLAHFSYEQYDLDKAFAQTIAACTEKTKMKALWQMAGIVRS